MERARLEAQLREGSGKGAARATRREGFVPAIIYGHKIEPSSIKLPELNLRRFISTVSTNAIINMEVDGDKTETVMLREVQIDPVTRDIMHADFVRVSLEERIIANIPLVLNGEPAGIEEGGVQQFLHRELQLECQVGNMPESIEIDVSALQMGDSICVADIPVEEGMTVMDDPATIIVSVAAPTILTIEEEEEILEGELEEEMEPEVIGEKSEEDEEEEMEEEE